MNMCVKSFIIPLFTVIVVLTPSPCAVHAADSADYAIRWTRSTPLDDLPAAHHAPNPAHGFDAWIASEGLRVRPRERNWEVGLELLRVGREGALREVEPAGVEMRGPRAELHRGNLVEWYVNDERGLEQGFTVRERPASGADGPLVLELALTGDLVPLLAADGRRVNLFEPGKALAVLVYGSLAVVDAGNREVPARMELASRTGETILRFLVDDLKATYPLKVDPLLETAAWTSSAEFEFTWSVAWGDLDGDGDLDLAVGNEGEPNRVYENTGGDLVSAWTSDDSDDTRSVAWGDWDGDGDLDLVAGNYDQPNRVYENTGGTLSRNGVWNSGQSENTTSVAWGDWDDDGDLDLAVGNDAQLNRVYENTGEDLEPAWTSVDSDPTSTVAWGDWDGDGDLDLAAGNYGQPNRVYDNTDGVLGSARTSLDSDKTTSVAWGDWDGDGNLELAAGNDGQSNRVYENSGATLPSAWISGDSDATFGVAWGDWDGDGNLDLAAGNRGPNTVYENSGLNLTLAWTSNDSEGTSSVAWGDWDGDGDLDLAAGNWGWTGHPYPNRVYENRGGALAIAWISDDEDETEAVVWGDWDGDGDLDLAAGNRNQPNRVYENIGGALAAVWASLEADNTYSVVWGDWDGDGDLDLAVGNGGEAGNGGQANRVYENTGGDLALAWTSTDDDDTRSLAWGDWDGDGDLDLAAANLDQPNRVYENTGGYLAPAWTSPESEASFSVAWGDWDGDGDPDLAVGNGLQSIRVYANTDGELTSAWTSPELDRTRSVAWGDWDGDGDLDLAAGNPLEPNRVYENTGGYLALAWSSDESDKTRSVAWGDWDGDGDLDLAAGNRDHSNRIYENTAGALESAWMATDNDDTRSVAWGDWDCDGDLDLAAGNWGTAISVYENGVRRRPGGIPETSVFPVISQRPGNTYAAFFHSTAECLRSPIEIPYTLFDEESDPARRIEAQYSDAGGGSWHTATGSWIGGAQDLPASPGGEPHHFLWDNLADGVIRDDDVVFRITVPYQAATRVAGPIQRAAMSAVSPPFRICEPGAGLSITKTDGRASIAPGETITYTITVTNNGPPDVTGASVTDAFPAELTDVSWSCNGSDGGTCSNPSGNGDIAETVDLPVGASVTFTADCTVDPAATGKLKNEACAPFDNCASDTTWVEIPDPLVKTLILAHPDRMGLTSDEADSLLDDLQRLANHPLVLGRVINLGENPELTVLYSDWDADPANADKANAVLFAEGGIHDLILDWRQSFPREYLILVGGDSVIPFARFADDTIVPESRYTDPTDDLWGLSADGTTVGQALAADKYLSDDPLASRESGLRPGDLDNSGKLFLPDLALGRLVESPEDVTKVIDAFISQQGILDLTALDSVIGHKVLVSGYHFLLDVAKLNRKNWKTALEDTDSNPYVVVNEALIGNYWDETDLLYHLCGRGGPPYRGANLNGHATHWELGVPGYGPIGGFHGLPTSRLVDPNACGVNQPLDLSGNLLYLPGCHAGLPVPNTEPEPDGKPLDLPEALASLGAAGYLANTGFGWGLKCGVGYSETLIRMFTDGLIEKGTFPVGKAVKSAKERYFTESFWMDIYDLKTLRQWGLTGIPNLELQIRPPMPAAPTSELGDESAVERIGPVIVERLLSSGSGTDPASGLDLDPSLPPHINVLDLHFNFTADGVYTKYRASGEELEGVEGCPGGNQPDPQDPLACTGCYYALNGLAQMATGEAHLPIQPYFAYDSRLSGVVQQGLLWTGATHQRETDWVPIFGAPSSDAEIDPRADFPEPIFIKPKPNLILPGGGGKSILNACNPTDPGNETVVFSTAEIEDDPSTGLPYSILKLYRTVDLEFFYLPESEQGTIPCDATGPDLGTPPYGDYYHQVDGTWIHWEVPASDASGVWRVVVVYDDGTLDEDGFGKWLPLELTDNGTGVWSGSLQVLGSSKLTYFLQAVDNLGNVTWLEYEVTPPSGIRISVAWPVKVTVNSDGDDSLIFGDGFESGDFAGWSNVHMEKMFTKHQEAPADETAQQSMDLDAGER